MKFLVTGGSGFIGRKLCPALTDAGHSVTILTRDKNSAARKLQGQFRGQFQGRVTLIDSMSLAEDGYDAVINLAGEPLADGRWTAGKKREIYASRLNTTQRVIDYVAQTPNKPALLLNGSAIGFFGCSETREFTEDCEPADHGFGHDLCHRWEQKALLAKQYGVRVVPLRIGVVLGLGGGALARMLPPFKLGLGGRMGSGRQWMSWVHVDDLIGIMMHVIGDQTIEGAVNATAPYPVTNAEFTAALGKALRRPTLLAVPPLALKLMFGEMAEELLLHGQKVLPAKAQATGCRFQYERISDALHQIVG